MSAIFDTGEFERRSFEFSYEDVNYECREASGGVQRQFTEARIKYSVATPDGGRQPTPEAGKIKPLLVHLCTYTQKNQGGKSGKRIDLKTVEDWPDRLVDELFNKIKELSGIDEEDKLGEELGKALSDPSAPCTVEQLREHVEDLGKDNYPSLWDLIRPSMEEEAGNSPEATPDGLE